MSESAVEVDTTTGTVVKALTNGTVVQVFLLADSVAAGNWSGNGRDGQDGIPLVAGEKGTAVLLNVG